MEHDADFPSPRIPGARKASHALPDLLVPGLDLVLCGTAAGTASANAGAYYAGPGNKFWSVLAATGLTPRRLQPHEFRGLIRYGIGLTDIAKIASGPDAGLRSTDFDVADFERRVLAAAPRFLAFNGKRAASAFLSRPTRSITFGPILERIGETELYVLPSTSGAASGFWDERHWRALADALSVTIAAR